MYSRQISPWFFSSDRKFLHFFLFLPSPANSNTCISIATSSHSFFFLVLHCKPGFLELQVVWQQCAARAAADLSPCVFSLSPCRLLLLQVMPLSHLHPSHSLLVQTCLVLYLSALLPYPQVRKALELQSGIRSGEQCPALLCISVLGALILAGWKWGRLWGQCFRARQSKSSTSREYIGLNLSTFFKAEAKKVTESSSMFSHLDDRTSRYRNKRGNSI